MSLSLFRNHLTGQYALTAPGIFILLHQSRLDHDWHTMRVVKGDDRLLSLRWLDTPTALKDRLQQELDRQ